MNAEELAKKFLELPREPSVATVAHALLTAIAALEELQTAAIDWQERKIAKDALAEIRGGESKKEMEKSKIDINAVKARLGSVSSFVVGSLPKSVQRLLTVDLPEILALIDQLEEKFEAERTPKD